MKEKRQGKFLIYFNLAELKVVKEKLENGAPNRKSVKRGKINKIIQIFLFVFVMLHNLC